MNEFTTMYHYFKGISSVSPAPSTSTPSKVMIEPKSPEKSSRNASQKSSVATATTPTTTAPTLATLAQQEYMEMSCSDQDSNGSNGTPPCNAVSNLNYINIESNSKDEEMQKNLNDFKINEEPEIMSNELRILEPAYYDSTEMNNKADAFSQECSNALENLSSAISSSLNSSTDVSSCASSAPDTSQLSDYLIQPSNIPVAVANEMKKEDFGDYLTHPSNKPVCNNTASNNTMFEFPENVETSHLKLNFKKKDSIKSKGSYSGGGGTLKRQGSDTSKTSVDDELLEIMNDFKNNVFTIQEVEQLVVSWKNRNDVQQSYKDKQEQLQRMRTEYDRLQDQMKDKMKRPTPFERMKKLFSRSKSNEETANDLDTTKVAGHRPMSSLSLQSISSSSSSGRMSTGSVCSGASLGDSGTHSDHEDRRPPAFNSATCRIGLPGSLMMDNYLIPPTPRPVSSPIQTPTSPLPCAETQRKYFPSHSHSKSAPVESTSEHYVLFPSNVPVFPTSPTAVDHGGHHDYINFSGLNTIEETKESDLTGVTLQPIKVQKPDALYAPVKKINTSDLCSSFKPDTHHSQKHFVRQLSDKDEKNVNELMKSIGALDLEAQESLKCLTQSIDRCTASLNGSSSSHQPKNGEDTVDGASNHDYMNV